MAKSLPDLMASVRQMLVGLEANAETVATRGATAEFTQSGKTLLASIEALEAEQETLKAALKAKTAALEITLAQLKTWNSEASSAVKLVHLGVNMPLVDFCLTKRNWADSSQNSAI